MAILAEQTIEGHISLDARTVNASKNGRTFALRVRGDSMIDAHILDGDIVILEDRKDVQSGDIVAALIDGETTLKRYVLGPRATVSESRESPLSESRASAGIAGARGDGFTRAETGDNPAAESAVNVRLNIITRDAMLETWPPAARSSIFAICSRSASRKPHHSAAGPSGHWFNRRSIKRLVADCRKGPSPS